MDIFQAKLEHLLAQKREWAEFFQAQSQAEQQGGSNRDLVLLFAFAGEMPGVPFSCAAAVKGVFFRCCNGSGKLHHELLQTGFCSTPGQQ